jgi:hypothetical protein
MTSGFKRKGNAIGLKTARDVTETDTTFLHLTGRLLWKSQNVNLHNWVGSIGVSQLTLKSIFNLNVSNGAKRNSAVQRNRSVTANAWIALAPQNRSLVSAAHRTVRGWQTHLE